eukprot:CAMPEP_0181113290 /NCGR_PEP_ID=MMETSP1071-20121207/20269_1 /TAXON_ID=35127 /ORGANISM="Thalassiosira sp., Strain NH16" /LENGTH=366 /DNA_ID=CAMNT_0023197319 /DNA_START=409 /DNA_END=1509 /DNA_ORIENTATION=+
MGEFAGNMMLIVMILLFFKSVSIYQVPIRRDDEYSDDQIRALAAHDVVMLEKANGHRAYGSVEEGTLQAAKRIKAINPSVKILFYLNAMVHYGGYSANDDWKEEWAMYSPKRKGPLKWRNKFLSYDHTNLEFREWWIQRGLDMVANEEIDGGIFIDGIVKSDRRWLPVKNHAGAYIATAKELRERLPEGKILIGNALRAGANQDGNLKHLEYLDGSYLEGWAHKRLLAKTLQLMSAAQGQGKMVMLTAKPHRLNKGRLKRLRNKDDRYSYEYVGQPQFIDFPLGFFLLVVEPHSYFSYHVGVNARPSRRRPKTLFDNTQFDAITRELGKPLGSYTKRGRHVYTREFEHLKVHVNTRTMTGTLTVKE